MQMSHNISDILPPVYRAALRNIHWEAAQELRLRAGRPVFLRTAAGEQPLRTCGPVTRADLDWILSAATGQSAYSAQEAVRDGYFTLPGGHRLGICGTLARHADGTVGLKSLTSLNIRLAHDVRIDTGGLRPALRDSLLIVGPPGSGKTTLLRACIRALSRGGACVGVVDERGELGQFDLGEHVDVLCGCGKQYGLERLLRTMGPDWLAVDEISAEEDVYALEKAAYCGVRLLATAHACSTDDLRRRRLYRLLLETGVFRTALVLDRNQTFSEERLVTE